MKKPKITKIEVAIPKPKITQISAQSHPEIWGRVAPEERQREDG